MNTIISGVRERKKEGRKQGRKEARERIQLAPHNSSPLLLTGICLALKSFW